VRFLPLADSASESHLSCAHLNPGATIDAPSLTHSAALLAVHGRVIITSQDPFLKIQVHAGNKGEPYSLLSETGAILLILESDELAAHPRGISNRERIAGATWPSDTALT
jgi:hypothetical protein